ncbi:MAG: Zinc ribbon domain [Microbacteriaceae bacterium]|nr:Zinc ribbon domain [Microbacteriaceae bacterium]
MPLYDFRCATCAQVFESWQAITAAERTTQCDCGAVATRTIVKVSFAGSKPSSLPARRDLPSSLRGVGGTREGVAHFQRIEEKVSRFESKNPNGAPELLPVASHEGPRGVVYARPATVATPEPQTKR